MPEGAQILIEGALLEGTQQSDASGKGGMVTLTLIREGFGNQRDNHFYPKELLEGFAKSFEGAQMYSNHLSPDLVKKLKGLPRDIQDLMGRIREAWVDKDDDGKTVVRGKASISQKWLWDMVEHDPELLGVSINARGSSTKGMKEGREANIVEAISGVGSVDWVSKAGAGGKVYSLMEAQAEEEGYTIESDGDGDAATATTEDAGESPATITHHHHDHHKSVGAGKHKHVHSHSHPNAVEGEAHRHVEVLEQPEIVEADPENPGDPSASTSHSHDHVHESSEGPGDHLHVHHHHHEAAPGEVHSHEGSAGDDGGEETPSDAGSSSGDGDSATTTTTTETPAGEDADKGGEGDGDAAATEAAASAGELGTASTVHHHYHHHGSMGGGMHTHRHHHKTVAGETHEHVVDSGAGNPDAQGYDSPAKSGTHNHHHHHASMGTGKHVHHHTHELVGSREAHAHQMEPLQEAGTDDEGETTVNEAGDTMTSIDEANWIAGAIKHKGALHKDMGIPEGEKIPVAKLEEEAKKPGKIGKRARLALTLMKLKRKKKKKGSTKEGEYEYTDWDLDTDEVVEADIEARANEIAAEKLREGVRAAVEMARADFEKKLKEAVAENDFDWGRKVSQLEQRHAANAVIEASELPVATQKALKADFHDRFFEDRRDSENGSVRKAGVDLCREAVEARIEKKREELKEAGAATHINEAGESAISRNPGERSGETRPKTASLDDEIDQELELDAGEKTSAETA